MAQQYDPSTGKPLVQNQQPLTQAADQQPVFQRSIDPNKLKAFMIQKNYKDKITTILGDDNPETAEIFNMKGMNWKEKYAEAKTRTSPLVDKIDQLVMNDKTTVDDMIRFYTENPNLTKGEASLFRSGLSTVKSRIATSGATRRSRDIAYSKEQEEYDKHENQNYLNATNAYNIYVDVDSQIQHLTGNTVGEESLEKDEHYKILMDNISKFLGNDYTDEDGNVVKGKYGSGSYGKVSQAVWALSQKLEFPKNSGYTDAQGNWIEWIHFDAEDPVEATEAKLKAAQSKWAKYMMNKIDELQKSAIKVTDFVPTQPEFKQDLQHHRQEEEENVKPNEQVGTGKSKFNWANKRIK